MLDSFEIPTLERAIDVMLFGFVLMTFYIGVLSFILDDKEVKCDNSEIEKR